MVIPQGGCELITFYFILSHLISFNLILFYFILFHFILSHHNHITSQSHHITSHHITITSHISSHLGRTRNHTPALSKTSRPDQFLCSWPECGRSYAKPAKLAEHLRSHTNTRSFVCEEETCKKSFLRKSHLKRHQETAHTGEAKKHVCPEAGCRQRFALPHHLARHCEIHQRSAFLCQLCKTSFVRKAGLRDHLAREHGQSGQLYVCASCERSFAARSKLLRHQTREHSGRLYVCGNASCGAQFPKWTELCAHRRQCRMPSQPRMPSQRPKAACSACGKEFSTKNAASVHMRTVHLDQRPYQCRLCQSEFGHKHLLARHMRTHAPKPDPDAAEAEPALALEIAGASYEAERPIACTEPLCRKRFFRQYDLRRHVASSHK